MNIKFSSDQKILIALFMISFVVFTFTSDGHRYTIDEDIAQKQTLRLISQESHPEFVSGVSRVYFDYPTLFPNPKGDICYNGILCSKVYLGHSLTQIPFVLINQNFHILTEETRWSLIDFNDAHYVGWRNSLDPDLNFMELFYGPFFAGLGTGVFYLICRSFNYRIQSSIISSTLFAFSTIIWAYSQTSLNSLPVIFFVMLAFWFFRKFEKNKNSINLFFCALALGVGLNIRPDSTLFIVVFSIFAFYLIRQQNEKLKKLFSFLFPIASAFVIFDLINFIRFEKSLVLSNAVGIFAKLDPSLSSTTSGAPTITNFLPSVIYGFLFSPGIGIFIFSPILFLIFLGYFDFYKKNRLSFYMFTGFIILFFFFYGVLLKDWHGLSAWSARYMLPLIPFLIIPIVASIESRSSYSFKISILVLGGFGVFFNLVYLVQDVPWFVWGIMGYSEHGLYSINDNYHLRINPLVLWTFEFSQLTHATYLAFTNLQVDLLLLKLLGTNLYFIIFLGLLTGIVLGIRKILINDKLKNIHYEK